MAKTALLVAYPCRNAVAAAAPAWDSDTTLLLSGTVTTQMPQPYLASRSPVVSVHHTLGILSRPFPDRAPHPLITVFRLTRSAALPHSPHTAEGERSRPISFSINSVGIASIPIKTHSPPQPAMKQVRESYGWLSIIATEG